MSCLRHFRKVITWMVWAVFILSVGHRLNGLGIIPAPHQTNDEYFFLWTGMSMIEGDSPRSWTMLTNPDTPTKGTFLYKDVAYTIMDPAFDQPPLFCLLTGISAKLVGARTIPAHLISPDSDTTFWEIDLAKLRLMPLLLYVAAFWFLWGWLRLVIGPAGALIAVTLYAFVEIIVVHQRLVEADNLVTPLVLASFYFLERWRRGWARSKITGVVLIATVSLAGASKVVALSAVPAIFAWASTVFRGRRAVLPCIWAILGAVLSLALILAFAFTYGFADFQHTMSLQAVRFTDLAGLYDLIRMQPMVHENGFSGWIIGGWILAFMGAATTSGAQRAVFVALFGYTFGYVFFAQADCFGWYVLTFSPFLCAAWGTALRSVFRNPARATSMVTILLLAGVALINYSVFGRTYITAIRYGFALLAVLVLIPWGFKLDRWRANSLRIVTAVLLIAGIVGEILHLILYQQIARGAIHV